MKNYRNIKRLYEQEAIQPEDVAELGMQPEAPMEPAQPAEPTQPEMEEPLALPAPTPDVMSMTVADFIAKCKEVDPLVCMGLESFIEKNSDAFGGSMEAPAAPAQDITFSNAIANPMPAAPAPAQSFSLDQAPEELNFPANQG
jgi:hypothetical protein